MVDKNKKPSRDMISFMSQSAKRTYGLYEKFLKSVQNPDRILKKTADGMRKGLELYEEMELDAQVYSDLQTRKLKVRSFPWDIIVDSNLESDKEQVVELKKDVAPIFRDLVKEIQDALGKGFAVVDIIYDILPDRIGIKSIEGMDQADFVFSQEWELRVKTESAMVDGEPIPDKKVVLATFDRRKGNLYGRSILMPCFWPWYFKKYGWLFWSNYIEKYGQPTTMGTFPKGTEASEQDKFLESLESIQNDFAFVIPEGFKAELLEAKRTGAGDTYENFLKFCDRSISKVILSSTLATNEADFGSRAQAEVHETLTDEVIEDDAIWIQDVLNNTIIRWLSEWNYNFSIQPRLIVQYKTNDTSKTAAERDEIVSRIIPVPVNHLYDKYNIPRPSKEDIVSHGGALYQFSDALNRPATAASSGGGMLFSEYSEDDLSGSDLIVLKESEYIDKIFEANRKTLEDTVDSGRIKKIIEKSSSYQDLLSDLEKYKSDNGESVWSDLMTLARLTGEYSVQKQIERAKESEPSFAEAKYDENEFHFTDPKDAIKWFKKKIPVNKKIWEQISSDARNAAFYISGIEDLDLINFIKETMLDAIVQGKSYREFKDYFYQSLGAPRLFGNMKTVFYTNMFTAMSVQNETALRRSTDIFPYWRYSAVMDGKTREDHAGMHNFVARYDDPVWASWTPPNGFNCRCKKVIATKSEYEKLRPEAEKNPTQHSKPDEGFDHNPLDEAMKSLRELLGKKEGYSLYLNGSVRSEIGKKLEQLNG